MDGEEEEDQGRGMPDGVGKMGWTGFSKAFLGHG